MLTQIGQSVARATEIDASLEWGFRLDLDEITAGDFATLKLFRSEKQKFQQELDEQQRNEQRRK